MVTLILLRALHKDIARYNSLLDEENGQDEFGWKLVHADVFRPPMYRMLLSTLIGNGVQIFSMLSVTILFAALGLLSPSVRGGLGTIMLATYILFSCLSGYVSARLYKSLEGKHWKTSIALTAYLIPG
jgi:transmembrane 9 superfamily protein 2/4